jgi:LacI family transcriptional regulator
MTKKVSIAEIARQLGVSKTLVSLVLNDKADDHGISRETQERVREKIRELNYQPDILAQGFRTGKTRTIGLIVSDISNLFYARIARRIEDYAWNNGYSVVICSTDEKVEKEMEQIRLLRGRKVDGIIISSSQENATYFNRLTQEGFPHVLIDRTFTEMQSVNVTVDNFGGARLAARHLLSQGFKRFAVISITPEHISTINERIKGFESAITEAGLELAPKWHIRAPFHDLENAVKDGLQRIYQSGDLPEAIFTLNNNLTSIALKYLRKLSIRIPEEVALIGFDDLVYFSYTHPSISAIEQPVDRISENSFQLLLKQIRKETIPLHERSVYLPVDIIIRESSVKTH